MTYVFAFPPVAVIAGYWTQELPTSSSRSMLTGASYVSATQRRRTLAGFSVHGRRQNGAGHLEALWRLMDGGVNLVRLNSCRVAWGRAANDSLRGGGYFDWEVPPGEVTWLLPQSEIDWFYGSMIRVQSITEGPGYWEMEMSGLPANTLVAIPGEFVTLYSDPSPDPESEQTLMIVNSATSNAAGWATIRVAGEPLVYGRASIGTRDTGVFEIVSDWPMSMRRAGMTDAYSVEFRQVFEDERGPFVEVDPWS